MNVFSGLPFLRILPAFCFGIICCFFNVLNLFVVVAALIFGFAVLLTIAYFKNIIYKLRFFRGLTINIIFFALGFGLTTMKDGRDSDKYFMNYKNINIYKARVKNCTLLKNNKYRLVSSIVAFYNGSVWNNALGDCYIYLPSDSNALALSQSDEIIFLGKPDSIPKPLNPGQFDFKRFASIQRIYVQFLLKANEWKMVSVEKSFSIGRIAEKIRNQFLKIYQRAGLSGQEYAVLSALVLGYDDEIDQKTVQAFSSTGTLHVLSVSGMHVGIIFSALSGILFFMEKKKSLKLIRFFILITSLWFYALLTGFSPSVIRSAMMFSFILIGRSLNRSSSIYNSLALSAFSIFILFDPLLLFNTGLQLSFTAVWGIAFLYNGIYQSIILENRFVDKIWSLVAVSIAAQAATFAISIYYFHQFPNYFILANLIIIPISTVCIFAGIGLLFLDPFSNVSVFVGKIIQLMIHWLNESAIFIEHLPYAVWSSISISLFDLFLLYIFLIVFVFWLEKKSISFFYSCLSILNIFFLFAIFKCYPLINRNGFIVFSGTSGICCQRICGYDSWLLFNPIDSIKAKIYSDNYCNSTGLPLSRRKFILLQDSLNSIYDNKIGIINNRIVFGKFIIHLLSETDINNHSLDSLKSDLLYINRNYFMRRWTEKFKNQKIIFTDNRKNINMPDSFYGKNIYNLSQGAKWIELQ